MEENILYSIVENYESSFQYHKAPVDLVEALRSQDAAEVYSETLKSDSSNLKQNARGILESIK